MELQSQPHTGKRKKDRGKSNDLPWSFNHAESYRLKNKRILIRTRRRAAFCRRCDETVFRAVAARRRMYPFLLHMSKKRVRPKKKYQGGMPPLCKPPRFAHLCTSWTKPQKLCHTDDDSLHYSFTALPAAMYVRSRQKQTGTMCPHRALWGGIKGESPLTPFSLGYHFFWARKKKW